MFLEAAVSPWFPSIILITTQTGYRAGTGKPTDYAEADRRQRADLALSQRPRAGVLSGCESAGSSLVRIPQRHAPLVPEKETQRPAHSSENRRCARLDAAPGP